MYFFCLEYKQSFFNNGNNVIIFASFSLVLRFPDTYDEGHYSLVNFTSGWGWMQSTSKWWGYQEKLILGKVTFVDVAINVTSVTLNGKDATFISDLTNKVSAARVVSFL